MVATVNERNLDVLCIAKILGRVQPCKTSAHDYNLKLPLVISSQKSSFLVRARLLQPARLGWH